MGTLKGWVASVAVGVLVGLMSGLVVLGCAWLRGSLSLRDGLLAFIPALIAGVGGACVQSWMSRKSASERLADKLPRKYAFPMLVLLAAFGFLLVVLKSEGDLIEKVFFAIVVLVLVYFAFWRPWEDKKTIFEAKVLKELARVIASTKNKEVKAELRRVYIVVASNLEGKGP